MTLLHELPRALVLVLRQRRRRFDGPLVLAHHMPARPQYQPTQLPLSLVNHLHRHVAQGADAGSGRELLKIGHPLLALLAPLGIFATGQLVLDHAVDDHHAQVVGIDPHELPCAAAAVILRGVPLPPGRDDHLIHDPHGHARELVLGLLADQRQAIAIHLHAGERQQRQPGPYLDRRAARQAAPAERPGNFRLDRRSILHPREWGGGPRHGKGRESQTQNRHARPPALTSSPSCVPPAFSSSSTAPRAAARPPRSPAFASVSNRSGNPSSSSATRAPPASASRSARSSSTPITTRWPCAAKCSSTWPPGHR